MPDRPANPVRAVEHTCELLNALYDLNGGGVTQLADRLEVSKSTVHNHLATLESKGFVVNRGREYQLGYRFLTLGGAQRDRTAFYRMAKEHVDDLAAETGEIAAVTTEENGQNVYLYVATGRQAVTTDLHLGSRRPMHCLASGKAILAAYPDERVEAILEDQGLPVRTPNTITDPERLFETLVRIRERGFAFDNEERIQGMRAVAATVRNEADDTVLGAVVVSGSTNRVQGDYYREELPELVTSRAREIEINATYS